MSADDVTHVTATEVGDATDNQDASQENELKGPGGDSWEAQFEKIQEYKARHGNTRVPAVLDTPRFPRLGAWVAAQRMAYRQWHSRSSTADDLTEQQVITQQRLKKLEEIGFEFTGIAKKVWNEKFELLKQFKEEFGTCCDQCCAGLGPSSLGL